MIYSSSLYRMYGGLFAEYIFPVLLVIKRVKKT